MPASGVQINSTYAIPAANAYAPDSTPHVAEFSDGRKIALFRATISSTDSTTYAVYNGSSWAASTGVVVANNPLSHPHSIVQVGDTAYIVWVNASNWVVFTALPWNAATHTMGAVVTSSLTQSITFPNCSAISAVWDSTHSWWYILGNFNNNTGTVLNNCAWSGTAGTAPTRTLGSQSGPYAVANAAVSLAQHAQSDSVIYAVTASGYLTPVTLGASGAATLGASERFTTSINTTSLATAWDANGYLDVVFQQGSNPVNMATVKRTGTGVYSSIITIDANIGSSTTPLSCTTTSGGDLWVLYGDTSVQATGEVWLAKRVSGSWQAPTRFFGGDALGYQAPTATATFDGSNAAEFMYTNGTSTANYAVYVFHDLSFSAPNTPIPLNPIGTVGDSHTTPTPAFGWTYSNPAPGDGQGAYELHVIRISDSHVMWDSGQVTSNQTTGVIYGATSNTSDGNYVAPQNLAYNVQYGWQVKTWDAQGNLASSYCSQQTFTPQQAPSGSITSIASPTGGSVNHGSASSTLNGATLANATSLTVQTGDGSKFTTGQQVAVGVSPNIDLVTISGISGDVLTVATMTHAHSNTDPVVQAGSNTVTLAGASMDVTVEVQQANGHSVNAYQIIVYDATGLQPQITGSVTTLSPAIAPGSTFTATNPFSLATLANSANYQVGVILTDATTNLTGSLSDWTATTNFSPPAAPTGFTVTLQPDTTSALLSWTNPGSPASVNVYRRLNGTTAWTLLASGTVRTTLTDFPPYAAVDYGVQTVASTGSVSSITTVTNQTLGIKYGSYGYVFNDVTDPLTTQVALGGIDSWDSSTGRDHTEDALTYTPSGRTAPITSYGLADYWGASQRKFWVPNTDSNPATSNTTTFAQIKATLTTMVKRHNVLLYRDPLGDIRFVLIEKLRVGTDETLHGVVSFDWYECAYSGGYPVI